MTNPPREHCGDLAPQTLLTTPRTECVLRPGHQGSHADDRGCRWWPEPAVSSAVVAPPTDQAETSHTPQKSTAARLLDAFLHRGPGYDLTPPHLADQTALRDRIAAAIREFPFDDFGLDDLSYLLDSTPDTQEWVPKLAAAVLAVLPAPADQAAVRAALRRADDAEAKAERYNRAAVSAAALSHAANEKLWRGNAWLSGRVRELEQRTDRAGEVLRVVEVALGDTLVASARAEALEGITAVLTASTPADQAPTPGFAGRDDNGQPARSDLLNTFAAWLFTTSRGSRQAADRILGKHRGEVLRWAADAIEDEQAREETEERARHGFLDHETELQGAAVRAKAELLRRLADETPDTTPQPTAAE